jgi:DNA-binding transcriptional MocR family regulator
VSKRARGKCGRFLALRSWLLESPAWRSLPATARALYIEIAARYRGSNNGRISYSVREGAKALHISKATACRMLGLLKERGFIVCTKRGAFSRKTVREASEWRLTEHNSDYPVVHATKDFMRWQPLEESREN